MKINKLTSALVALGLISLAGTAQATTTIYLTGSTAARQFVFNCLTNTSELFTNVTHIYPAGETGGDNQFYVEGTLTNGGLGDVIFNCSFTGSEAGIASVAGTAAQAALTQTQPADPNGTPTTPYGLPGVPPSYFNTDASGNKTVNNAPDIAMADTSQAVSQTPYSLHPLHDYGVVGIVPFTFLKGYQYAPDSTWSNLVNVTTAAINRNFTAGANFTANVYTGNPADNVDGVAIIGRNKGSGTRANCMLATQVGVNAIITQFAYGTGAALYPATGSSANVLTYTNDVTLDLLNIGNDGFDSGSGVSATLEADNSYVNTALTEGLIVIGYAGISDAKGALNKAQSGTGGKGTIGPAKALAFNGVYEGDTNVINGAYTFWGEEHVLGVASPSATQSTAAAALQAAISKELATDGSGTAAGVLTNNASQSYLIPTSLMKVHRGSITPITGAIVGSDTGFPDNGGF